MNEKTKKMLEADIKKLELQKKDLEAMASIKKKKIKTYDLQITLDTGEMAVFRLSQSLGGKTLSEDIKEDGVRIERLEKDLKKKKDRL